jgi:signal transduction histidine kinase
MDTGGLAQVLLNLFINASHAMPQGGKIKVTIEKTQDQDGKKWTCLKVADTGTGIRDEVLPRIFDFAYSTKGDAGSGLGLAVSKQIIEGHGGKITVKTELGKGTEFSILLPISGEG